MGFRGRRVVSAIQALGLMACLVSLGYVPEAYGRPTVSKNANDIAENSADIAETRAAICDLVDHEGLLPRPDFCPEALLECPCWSTFTASELASALNSDGQFVDDPSCSVTPEIVAQAWDNPDLFPALAGIEANITPFEPSCLLNITGAEQQQPTAVTPEQAKTCAQEVESIIPRIDWCP